ncbi:MAG: CBS domain-containing protein [Gammaproteobacteria bacterium]
MNVGHLRQHHVVTCQPADNLVTAARLMREKHVGFLVVVEVDAQDGDLTPIGVITDRDIVISVVAEDVSPHSLTVGDVMTRKPVVALSEDPLSDSVQQMRLKGVRRLPVVGTRGHLVGVISLDDVLTRMAADFGGAAGAISKGRALETEIRP